MQSYYIDICTTFSPNIIIICTAASAITTPVRAADTTVTVSEDTNTNFATTNTMATFQDCACKEGRLTIKIDQYSLPFSYCACTSAYLNRHVMCLPQLSSHARYITLVVHVTCMHCVCVGVYVFVCNHQFVHSHLAT